jgi:hypothetical protein
VLCCLITVFEGITEALICTWQHPFFWLPYVEQVWMAWNFKNTEFQDGNSETPYEVRLLYEYFVCVTFRTEQQLSIHETEVLEE